MSEIKTKAAVYLIDYICDKCGKGKMVRSGQLIFAEPLPFFPHTCEVCDYTDKFTTSYPVPRFEKEI